MSLGLQQESVFERRTKRSRRFVWGSERTKVCPRASPFLTGGHHTQSLYIYLTLHAKFTSPAPPPLAISTENPFFPSPPHHSLPPLPSHCEAGQFRSCCPDDVTPDRVGVSSSARYLQRNSCVSCPSVLRRWAAGLFNLRQILVSGVTTARGLAVSRTCSK